MPARIPTEELINDITRLADELGRPPTENDIIERGEFSAATYRNRFGSFPEAREAAGLQKQVSQKISKQDLIDELIRVYQKFDRIPTKKDIDEFAEYHSQTYYNRFGSLPDAHESAGLESKGTGDRQFIEKDNLVSEFKQLATDLGRPPTRNEMNKKGKYNGSTYEERWGSWNEAVRSIGFDPVREVFVSKDELIKEIHRLADELGHPPKYNEMEKFGEYSAGTFERQFGRYNNAVSEAGYEPQEQQSKIPEEELVEELRRLKKEVGRPPSAGDIDLHGQFHSDAYLNHFDSLYEARRQADIESDPGVGEYHYNWKGGESTRYSDQWSQIRERIIQRDNEKCVDCGLDRTEHQQEYDCDLHVHHRRPLREFEDPSAADVPENLITLCSSCHRKWESLPVQPMID